MGTANVIHGGSYPWPFGSVPVVEGAFHQASGGHQGLCVRDCVSSLVFLLFQVGYFVL